MTKNDTYSLKTSWNKCEILIQKIAERKKIDKVSELKALKFLQEIGFISSEIKLSKKGKNYYTEFYILNNPQKALSILSATLRDYKPVIAICTLLWGFPNLTKESIYRLLLTNELIDENFSICDITGFIMILNQCQIIRYSKKNNIIKIVFNPKSEDQKLIQDTFISPDTPFSNIKTLKEIIRSCTNFLWWIDKHFSKKGLDPLIDELDGNLVQEVKILTSINASMNFEKFRKEFKRFKQELKNKGIKAEFRVLVDKTVINEIHGRWIISEKIVYNMPPVNSIFMGQYDEFLRTKEKPPFKEWWKESKDIISEWAELHTAISTKA